MRRSLGFSLIELMVSLVIGLITAIAVAQIYANWVKQNRTVSSTNDLQSTVALAAFAIEQDIKRSGQGFGAANSTISGGAGCPISGTATVNGANNSVVLSPTGTGGLRLTGVQIIRGIDGASDQIVTLYGNSDYRVASEAVLGGSTFNVTKVSSRAGFNNGDVVILGNSGFTDCRIVQVTSTDSSVVLTDKAFGHDTTSYQSFYKPAGTTSTPVFNQAGGVTGIEFIAAFNLGPAPQANQWRISTASPNSAQNPALQRFSVLPVDGVYPTPRAREVAEGAVNLQAQYGYDLNGDGRIGADEWYNPDETHRPDLSGAAVDWTRVLAIRYAILTRSRNYEPANVTTASPAWMGGGFVMTDIGGAADTNPDSPLNWRRYRYSVAESVVPLRNALWGRNQ
ncbi:PilW family protein [Rhodoferax aquaticus]|nr:PilW family protein [Rhodoferax aquaticus]